MDITPNAVQRGLQEFYRAEVTGHHAPHISKVTLLGSGFETDVYAFSLEASGGKIQETQDLVLRLHAGKGASDKSAWEFDAMRRLYEAGYPVPRVLALQRDPWPLGQPFLVMERIDGVSLEQSHRAAPEEARQALHVMHYRLMAQLHALPGDEILPDSPLADSRDPYGFIDHELAFLSELLHQFEGHEPPSLRHAHAWLASCRSTVPCERLAVVHGDFHRNNILLRADGAPCVIDWSNVRLADYRADLAWTRLISPWIFRSELDLYARLAGKAVSQIAYFEAVASLRLLLSVLLSLQFGAAHQGMRPGAEALMRRDADHTRRVAALLQARTGIPMPDLDDALSALREGNPRTVPILVPYTQPEL